MEGGRTELQRVEGGRSGRLGCRKEEDHGTRDLTLSGRTYLGFGPACSAMVVGLTIAILFLVAIDF